MNNLKIGLLLSLGIHLILFFHAPPFFGANQIPAAAHDYHLPIAVELIQVESAPVVLIPETVIPQPVVEAAQPDPFMVEPIAMPKKNNRPAPRVRKPKIVVAPHKVPEPPEPSIAKASVSLQTWNAPPIYPSSARRLGQEGRVILDAELDLTGKVISVKVSRSSGYPELDQAAFKAVSSWKMDVPANGSRRLFIPITFKLQSEF